MDFVQFINRRQLNVVNYSVDEKLKVLDCDGTAIDILGRCNGEEVGYAGTHPSKEFLSFRFAYC